MVLNQPPLPKTSPGIDQAVRPFIFAVVGCAIVYLLFSPSGLVFKTAGLGFLVLPLMLSFILHFFAKLRIFKLFVCFFIFKLDFHNKFHFEYSFLLKLINVLILIAIYFLHLNSKTGCVLIAELFSR